MRLPRPLSRHGLRGHLSLRSRADAVGDAATGAAMTPVSLTCVESITGLGARNGLGVVVRIVDAVSMVPPARPAGSRRRRS